MKKRPDASALDAIFQKGKDEPDQAPAVTEAPKAETKRKRFHTSIYLNRQTYDQIRIGLLKEGDGRDFNGLVTDLLKEWYAEARRAYDLEDWQDDEKGK